MSSLSQPQASPRNSTEVNYWQIPVGKDHVALVDEADCALVRGYTWHLFDNKRGHRYAQTTSGGKTLRMHRLILGATGSVVCDHINGDGLDNRRGNLRIATVSQNTANQRNAPRGAYRQRNGWTAKITVQNRSIYLGYFKTEAEAHQAFSEARRSYHGEFAR